MSQAAADGTSGTLRHVFGLLGLPGTSNVVPFSGSTIAYGCFYEWGGPCCGCPYNKSPTISSLC